MKIITVINDTTHFGFNLLRLSCALNDLELVVLVSRENFTTNRIKDELLRDYLSEISDDEIILFTDGNDVVFMAPETEILEKYNQRDSDLIFSAETDCWPDITLAKEYRNLSATPYKYLNSGGFIGRAGLIKELLEDVDLDIEKFTRSNQYVWTQRYFKNSDKIVLDTNCDIFITFTPQMGLLDPSADSAQYFSLIHEWFHKNFIIENGRIFNKITKTWACHAHFNGFSKALINTDIADMVYGKITPNKTVQFFHEVSS